jgi:hypothetical protein
MISNDMSSYFGDLNEITNNDNSQIEFNNLPVELIQMIAEYIPPTQTLSFNKDIYEASIQSVVWKNRVDKYLKTNGHVIGIRRTTMFEPEFYLNDSGRYLMYGSNNLFVMDLETMVKYPCPMDATYCWKKWMTHFAIVVIKDLNQDVYFWDMDDLRYVRKIGSIEVRESLGTVLPNNIFINDADYQYAGELIQSNDAVWNRVVRVQLEDKTIRDVSRNGTRLQYEDEIDYYIDVGNGEENLYVLGIDLYGRVWSDTEVVGELGKLVSNYLVRSPYGEYYMKSGDDFTVYLVKNENDNSETIVETFPNMWQWDTSTLIVDDDGSWCVMVNSQDRHWLMGHGKKRKTVYEIQPYDLTLKHTELKKRTLIQREFDSILIHKI